MRPDAGEDLRSHAPANALKKLREYFSPLRGGGPQGNGWPFGRALYLSEVYEALEQVAGVDYVDDLGVVSILTRKERIAETGDIGIKVGRALVGVDSRLGAGTARDTDRIMRDTAGKLVGIALRPYELISIESGVEDFSSGEFSAPQGSAGQNFEVST